MPLRPLQNSVRARRITALLSVFSNLGPFMAINISHRFLVRSRRFAGTRRFLAGLFTFLSTRPAVKRLRASGRNWFRTSMTTTKTTTRRTKTKKSRFSALSSATLCRAVKYDRSRVQMNGGKVVMQPETDVGSELSLTSSIIATLALQLSKLTRSNN